MPEQRPWHFRDGVVLVAVLVFLALALPLLWWSPYYSRKFKALATAGTLVLTYVTWVTWDWSWNLLQSSLQMLQ